MVLKNELIQSLESLCDPSYPYPVVLLDMEIQQVLLVREWLMQHGGDENQDWYWSHGWWGDTTHCFRFREQSMAEFFRLTWHTSQL
jgi:hypothetical protein